MTAQLSIVHSVTMEQALQTVIHDLRLPEKLRKALMAYRDLRERETGVLPAEGEEYTCLPEIIRSGFARREDENRESPPGVQEELWIKLCYNAELLDWSVEINGLRHEHVTTEVMEALVECALIVAEMSSKRGLTWRLQ
jgi:hypothetical protein